MSANQSQFFLRWQQQVFAIRTLTTLAPLGLSCHYRFVVNLIDNQIFNRDLLHQTMILDLGFLIPVMITEIKKSKDPWVELVMESPLYPLMLQKNEGCYLSITIKQLSQKIFQRYGLFPIFELTQKYPVQHFIQWQRTDFDWLVEQFAFWGIHYFFNEHGQLVLRDDFTTRKQRVFRFIADIGHDIADDGFYQLQVCYQLAAEQTAYVQHNPSAQNLDIFEACSNQTPYVGYGRKLFFAERELTNVEAKRIVLLRQSQCDQQRFWVVIKTQKFSGDLSEQLILKEFPCDWLNKNYDVFQVFVTVDELVHQHTRCEFTIKLFGNVPVSDYCPSFISPKIKAFVNEAVVDDLGRYSVNFPFASLASSPPLRLLHNNGVENCGWHFPLSSQTEVLLDFVYGDLQTPIILGCLYAENTNPVTANNATQYVLNADKGRQILLDDDVENFTLSLRWIDNAEINLTSAQQYQILFRHCSGDIKIKQAMAWQLTANELIQLNCQQQQICCENFLLSSERGKAGIQANQISYYAQNNFFCHYQQWTITGYEIKFFSENFFIDVDRCVDWRNQKTLWAARENLTLQSDEIYLRVGDSEITLSGDEITMRAEEILLECDEFISSGALWRWR